MSKTAKLIRFFLRLCQPWLLRARSPQAVFRLGQKLMELLARTHKPHPNFPVQRIQLGGVPTDCMRNLSINAQAGEHLFFIHGGGFAFGAPNHYRNFLGRLAGAARIQTVWAPDYRLSSQHPYPAALDDVLAAYKALLQQTDAAHIVLAGDSAGGNLSMALCLAARDQGLPLPKRVYLSSPWLNLVTEQNPYRPEVHDAFLGNNERKARLWLQRLFRDTYLHSHNPLLPTVSPVYGQLKGLPPTFVHAAADEVFSADCLLLAEWGAAQQWPVTVEVWDGLFHDFPLFAPRLPEAVQALSTAAAWLGAGQIPDYVGASAFRRVCPK